MNYECARTVEFLMDMETGIRDERDTTAKAIHVQPDVQIDAKDLLVELE